MLWLIYWIGVVIALPVLVLDARRPGINPPLPGWGLLLSSLLWPLVFPLWGFCEFCGWLSKISRPPILTVPEATPGDPTTDCQFCLTPMSVRALYCPRCGRHRLPSKT